MVEKLRAALAKLPHLEVKKPMGRVPIVAFTFRNYVPNEDEILRRAAIHRFKVVKVNGGVSLYPGRTLRSSWIVSFGKRDAAGVQSASTVFQNKVISSRQRRKLLDFFKAWRSPPN